MSNKMWGGRFSASPDAVMEDIKSRISKHLGELSAMSRDQLKEDRYAKFRRMGRFSDS